MKLVLRKTHPLAWALEPLETKADYRHRKMFGCEAAYLGDRLVLVLAAGQEPWNGMMVPAEREQHEALIGTWPCLSPHPILGKWLYLSQSDPAFEETALSVVDRITRGDPRIGTHPKPKPKRKGQTPVRRKRK